jgi:hypothetical protein
MNFLTLISQAKTEGNLATIVRKAVTDMDDRELLTLCGQIKRRDAEILAETKYWQVEE